MKRQAQQQRHEFWNQLLQIGLTQAQIARAFNVTQSAVAKATGKKKEHHDK